MKNKTAMDFEGKLIKAANTLSRFITEEPLDMDQTKALAAAFKKALDYNEGNYDNEEWNKASKYIEKTWRTLR
jgi:hypothetical protein